MKNVLQSLILLLMFSGLMVAEDKPNNKLSGYMFGDVYYVVANHDTSLEGQNGMWLRRIYFTYDHIISSAFTTRLRMEMANAGDFTTSAAMTPAVKDAYLQWKYNKTRVLVGISSSPTWEVVEKIWGYRSVEKTPLDLQKFGNSRDFGIAVLGELDNAGKLKYHLMLGNGNGDKSESNKGKKAMLALALSPNEYLTLEAYGDWNDNPGDNDVFTYQGFAAYHTKTLRVGVQFARQTRNVAGADALDLEIGSVFVASKLTEKTSFFARADRMFDANSAGNKISYIPFDNTAKSIFLLGGLDFTPEKDVHIMPNVEVVLYDENDANVKPDTDIIPRLSFYYVFK